MAEAQLAHDVQEFYAAPDVTFARRRLADSLADRGFWCVAEYRIALQFDRSFFDLGRYAWDNIEQRLGARRDDLRRGLLDGAAGRGREEANQRLRWRAAQKQPYLTMSGASTRFRTHRDIMSVYADFGLAAVDTLVVPLPRSRAGPYYICTVAERESDLQNVPEAVALISAYYLVSRLLAAENDDRAEDDETRFLSGEQISLNTKQQTVLRWAAAGKTHQDIADILGMPVRTVRYHIDRARERYGYATAQQTVVRAALDYGFDPLGAA